MHRARIECTRVDERQLRVSSAAEAYKRNGVLMGHLLIVVPAIGFVVAAGAGILVRARRANQDEHSRNVFSIKG